MGGAVVRPLEAAGERLAAVGFERTTGAQMSPGCPAGPSLRLGNKQVQTIAKLSTGNCCTVYTAVVQNNSEVVVLKIYDKTPRGRRECKREMEVLKIIAKRQEKSSFIISPRFAVRRSYIGLEVCEGGDLGTLLSHHSPSPLELQQFAYEIACGLHFLHSLGIIHEDIKPSNIGLTADKHVRILDFGLSEIVPVSGSEMEIAQVKVLSRHGTTPYACPEKLKRLPHGFEADWWSFGVTFYEMLFGELPWIKENVAEMCAAICEDPLPSSMAAHLEEIDIPALQFVNALIGNKDPAKRLGYRLGTKEFEAQPFFRSMRGMPSATTPGDRV